MLTASGETDETLFLPFGFERRSTVIAAVSGGGDSLAMLLMLRDHIDRHRLSTRLVAVTIDHGLRPEAADEARHVAALCEGWGIAHLTRRWDGEKPASGVAEAARNARYRLLADAAREAGADLIFTGHTRDDQAETFAMRLARGGGRGLAGMDRATLYDRRVWIVRPLLGIGRRELRQRLAARDIAWIDDPSNENLEAERVRVRAALARSPGEAEPAIRGAEAVRRERMTAGASVLAVFGKSAMTSPGLVRVPMSEFRRLDPSVGQYVLRILVATLGGRSHLPGAAQMPILGEGNGPSTGRATVSRCVIDRRRDAIYVYRESRGLPARCRAEEEIRWDGRFQIRAGGHPFAVEAVGHARAAALTTESDAAPRGLAAAALSAEPHATSDVAPSVERIVAPWALFLPQSDVLAYNGVAALIGAKTAPAGPSAGHIDAEA